MKKMFAALLGVTLTAALLGACGPREPATEPPASQPTETLSVPDTLLPVTMGTLETNRLEVPGDPSGCGITSKGSFWEVESGFYWHLSGLLYYADKSDLSNWIPVCNQADCPHMSGEDHTSGEDDVVCNAKADRVLIQDGRIYKTVENQSIFTLLSTALDGTDLRTEFVFTEAEEFLGGNAGSAGTVITQEYLATYVSVLNEQGTYDFRFYTADENGETLHIDEERPNMSVLISPWGSSDGLWFRGTALADDMTRTVVYTLRDNRLVSVDLTGLPTTGSYFTGDTLLAFRSNDGYYRIDTATREEVKLADPQLADSSANIALPNCILESNLFFGHEAPAQPAMWIFNGETWAEVTLPEELSHSEVPVYFTINAAVASDRILLQAYGRETQQVAHLYQILLTTDTPTLEYLADIG